MSSMKEVKHLAIRCLTDNDPKLNGECLAGFMSFGWSLIELKPNRRLFEEQFLRLENNQQRVAFVLNDNQLRAAIDFLITLLLSENEGNDGKSAEKASSLRKEGNQFFKQKDIKTALSKYNEAILWAPHDTPSEELSLIFGNRSAAFFRLNLYKEALSDVDEALKRNPSVDRIPMLMIRKMRCLKSMGKNAEALDVAEAVSQMIEDNIEDVNLKLSFCQQVIDGLEQEALVVPHPEINVTLKEPSSLLFGASKSIKMGYDPGKGRTVVATRDIEEGELVTIESPFVTWLDPTHESEHCHHCLRQLNGYLIPCTRCTSVSFCSFQCLDQSWLHYHRLECPHLKTLRNLQIKLQMSLRMAIIAGVQEIKKESKAADIPYSEWPERAFTHDLKSLSSLCSGDLKDFNNLYGFAFCASFLAQFAAKLRFINKKDKPYLADFVAKLLLQLHLNTFTIEDEGLKCTQFKGIFTNERKSKHIGSGLYGTASMFSHKCFCNAQRTFYGSEMIITTTQSIKSGEEVTVSYRGDCCYKSYADRQRLFKRKYNFTCRCVDCLDRREPPGFRCPNCGGNLVRNEDNSNHCFDCGEKDQNLSQIIASGSIARDNLEKGGDLISSASFDEALECLLLSEKLCLQFLHKDNYNNSLVKEPLSICYEDKEMFEEAIKYRLEAAHFAAKYSGDNSFQVLAHYVKVLQLYIELSRQRKEGVDATICLTQIKSLQEKCTKLLDKLTSMEFKITSVDNLSDLVSNYNLTKDAVKLEFKPTTTHT